MAGQLDLSQPYGQVYNDPDGRAFEQDGAFFTASGDLWTAPGASATGGSAKRRPAATQLDAQLADPAVTPQEPT